MNSTILYLSKLILSVLPETRFFGFKASVYRMAGAKIGKNVRICSSVKILGTGELSIGDNTWIGHETIIISSSKIKIGSNVDIAPKVYIGTGTHVIDASSSNIAGEGISKDILIENGCWLGVSSIILPGVIIKEKCVVASGAVLNKTIDKSHILIGGVPAKQLKTLIG